MEQEAREKEKKRQSESTNNLLTGEPVSQESGKFCALLSSHNKKTNLFLYLIVQLK